MVCLLYSIVLGAIIIIIVIIYSYSKSLGQWYSYLQVLIKAVTKYTHSIKTKGHIKTIGIQFYCEVIWS